jgi:hypothetical protein
MAVCYRTTPPPWLLLAISQPKWVTGAKVLTMDEVLQFDAPGDFHGMAGMGVNALRIPMPWRAFHDNVVVNMDFPCTVSRLLDRAEGAGLKAILVLVGGWGRMFWGWDCQWRNAGRPPCPTMTTTTTNATAPLRDVPSPIDLLDSLRRDILALFLVNNASLSLSTLMATGRGRPDNAPLLSSSYNYYAVLILARFPPGNWAWQTAVRTTVATTTMMPTAPLLLSATLAYNQAKA